jgi:hypothetical protein
MWVQESVATTIHCPGPEFAGHSRECPREGTMAMIYHPWDGYVALAELYDIIVCDNSYFASVGALSRP